MVKTTKTMRLPWQRTHLTEGSKCTPWAWAAPGAPIPLYDRFGRSRGFKTDADGNPIVTALDDATLIQVAEAGNGTYVQAGNGFVNIAPIIGAMNTLNQTETSTVAYTDFTHHFHWFFMIALFFILAEGALNLTFKPRMA